MRWNLNPLLRQQAGLDEAIFAKSGETYAATAPRRALALAVEVAELANALRFFKFWSLRREGDADAALEEFADVLHFALTFCVQYGANPVVDAPARRPKREPSAAVLTRLFSKLLKAALNVSDARSARGFLADLLKLPPLLGWTRARVVGAYGAKRAKNEARAASGY